MNAIKITDEMMEEMVKTYLAARTVSNHGHSVYLAVKSILTEYVNKREWNRLTRKLEKELHRRSM